MSIDDDKIYTSVLDSNDYTLALNSYINIILRDKAIDDFKNPLLGDLFKVLRLKKGENITYPEMDAICLSDDVDNIKHYYIFNGWESNDESSVQLTSLNNQELVAIREKYSIPNNVDIQLINGSCSLMKEFKVYSTKDFNIENQINVNGYQINISKNSNYFPSVELYEVDFEFSVNISDLIEGNCITLEDLDLKLLDKDTNQIILEHTFCLNIFSSDSSTGD